MEKRTWWYTADGVMLASSLAIRAVPVDISFTSTGLHICISGWSSPHGKLPTDVE